MICSLLALHEFLRTERRDILLISAFGAGLALLTRYAGITVVLTGFLMILFRPETRHSRRFSEVVNFLGFSLVGFFLWILRNCLSTGTILGKRETSSFGVMHNLAQMGKTVVRWLFPEQVPYILAGLFSLILLSPLFFLSLRRHILVRNRQLLPLLPWALFVIIYAFYLLISSSIVLFDPIDDRLLLPLFLPLAVIVLQVIDKIVSLEVFHKLERRQVVFLWAFGLVVMLVIGHWLVIGARTVREGLENGVGGYSTLRWHSCGLISDVQSLPVPSRIISNGADVVFLLAGLKAEYLPDFKQDLHTWKSGVREQQTQPTYLVWLTAVHRQYFPGIQEILSGLDALPIRESPEGGIYKIH